MDFKITSEEFLSLDDSLRRDYAKTYADALEETDKALREKLESPNVILKEVNGKTIKIVEASDEFSFIVRSSDSGLVSDNKELVDNSYVKSWYQTDNPTNHILAGSYITEKNMGSCPVKNKGVLYGFTNVNEAKIVMVSLNDSNSHINSVGYSSNRDQRFVVADDMSDYTMRIYDEIDLEKNAVTPDYIIIFDDFSSEQLENAYEAATEWNIPIVKINKVDIAIKQDNKINNLMQNFKATRDLNILKEALTLYEANCSGFKLNSYVREGAKDVTSSINNQRIIELGLFNTEKIQSYIMDYINELSQKSSNYEEVDHLINILDDIKYKYSLANNLYDKYKDNKLLANTKSNLDIDGLLQILNNIRR